MQHFENYTPRKGFEPKKEEQVELLKTAAKEGLLVLPRGNEFHIYYRGGKILGVRPKSLFFDPKYLERDNKNDIEREFVTPNDKLNAKAILENPSAYFEEAKRIMDDWFDAHPKQEREIQDQIAHNSTTATGGNQAVVDIEFAVSFNAPYYNRKYIDDQRKAEGKPPYLRYPNPRFDIIAIDATGQVHVYELKVGLKALDNAKKHVDDFNALIGSSEQGDNPQVEKSRYKSFLEEVQEMINTLRRPELGKTFPDVDTEKVPIFHFAFVQDSKDPTPNQFQLFQERIKHALETGVDAIELKPETYQL